VKQCSLILQNVDAGENFVQLFSLEEGEDAFLRLDASLPDEKGTGC
jgi:hypothetical protein